MSEQIADMTQIRDEYIEAWAGHFVRGKQGAARYFDQALNGHNLTIETAAEQRGAKRGLRDAATAIEKNNIVFDGDHYQPCNSCMSIHMNWLDYRADQIEQENNE